MAKKQRQVQHNEPHDIEHLGAAPKVRASREMVFDSLEEFENYIMDESYDNEFDNMDVHLQYLPPFIMSEIHSNEENIKPQMNSLNKKFRRQLQHHVQKHLMPEINKMSGIHYKFTKAGESQEYNQYGTSSVYKWHYMDESNHGFEESEIRSSHTNVMRPKYWLFSGRHPSMNRPPITLAKLEAGILFCWLYSSTILRCLTNRASSVLLHDGSFAMISLYWSNLSVDWASCLIFSNSGITELVINGSGSSLKNSLITPVRLCTSKTSWCSMLRSPFRSTTSLISFRTETDADLRYNPVSSSPLYSISLIIFSMMPGISRLSRSQMNSSGTPNTKLWCVYLLADLDQNQCFLAKFSWYSQSFFSGSLMAWKLSSWDGLLSLNDDGVWYTGKIVYSFKFTATTGLCFESIKSSATPSSSTPEIRSPWPMLTLNGLLLSNPPSLNLLLLLLLLEGRIGTLRETRTLSRRWSLCVSRGAVQLWVCFTNSRLLEASMASNCFCCSSWREKIGSVLGHSSASVGSMQLHSNRNPKGVSSGEDSESGTLSSVLEIQLHLTPAGNLLTRYCPFESFTLASQQYTLETTILSSATSTGWESYCDKLSGDSLAWVSRISNVSIQSCSVVRLYKEARVVSRSSTNLVSLSESPDLGKSLSAGTMVRFDVNTGTIGPVCGL
ncbi:hypothetical protein OGAPHI_005324 [Ogataea philodendri]|uniref:Respiratory growth induced protein 1 n=1 Tax=Ogataea philodendri TaxID=1378263 RepID=A0A9P8T2M9_9ASCO|nr:uncharacterized protein OGAPHI_005324 [Ogataea philodendri]KAH3663334.1 hypothetical protein OGAPHI_005324 [Ogataea philodendri]